jgi:hypothetical protein
MNFHISLCNKHRNKRQADLGFVLLRSELQAYAIEQEYLIYTH